MEQISVQSVLVLKDFLVCGCFLEFDIIMLSITQQKMHSTNKHNYAVLVLGYRYDHDRILYWLIKNRFILKYKSY